MATREDYIGKRFNRFEIGKHVGSGKEAEVYELVNHATRRTMILRLDGNDDDTWVGPAKLPPRNGKLEHPNVRGSYFAVFSYVVDNSRTGEDEWKVEVPTVYGLRDERYLIPLSDPLKPKGAIALDKLLDLSQPSNLLGSELVEDILGAMVGDAYLTTTGSISQESWTEKWAKLTGGTILAESAKRFMSGGSLDVTKKAPVLT